MTNINRDIGDWLHSQKKWLQLAALQLMEKGELSDSEFHEIIKVFKTAEGQAVSHEISFPSFDTLTENTKSLRLVSIGDIHGIGTLSPRKPLSFGTGNLTVIYGHNGSGKSGYTRLLKKISGKPRAIELKHNVYENVPEKRQCTVVYKSDSNEKTVEWIANTSPLDDLKSIDIFDSDAAGFYLSSETEVSYVPEAVSLFEKLALACDRIKALLHEEQSQLVCVLPQLPNQYNDTTAGNSYRNLSSVSESELGRLIEWRESDKLALAQISERLKVADPLNLAKQKRARQQQISQLIKQIRDAVNFLSTESIERLGQLHTEAISKRRIAIEAAKVNTSLARLDGIGTDTWNALWKAARDYSALAYPERIYPVTDGNALCVLCHQELNADAKKRMRDFETYVQSALTAEAEQAEKAYQVEINKLPLAKKEVDIRTQCEAAGFTEDYWLTELLAFWSAVGEKSTELKSHIEHCKLIGIIAPVHLLDYADQVIEQLNIEIGLHDADAQNFNRQAAEKQKLELEARSWVSQQATAIQVEIIRLAKIAEFEKWKRLTNSKAISVKADDISQKIITDAYVQRFNAELKALGAARIKVELIKTSTSKGKTKHRIRLKGAKLDHNSTDTILSEGERRVVALAAFLADVTGKPNFSPFVFDDPISSLDLDFEWEVAIRLAHLAKDRQVLVFTHRLSLYGAMEDAAKKNGDAWKKSQLEKRCIESYAGVSGHPADEEIWNANTTKANNILITRLQVAKQFSTNGDHLSYKLHAQGICSDFRKLIERTVEDDLLNEIVKRHRKSVTTDNRIGHLPKIIPDDCSFIDSLMTKYSCFEHSQSQESPSFIPDEADLRMDIEALKKWRDDFKNRH